MATTYIQLADGIKMPSVGFGTWQASDQELEQAIDAALETGYRHIDTAYVYENEHVIGRTLKKWLDSGKLKREELFITTKLPEIGNRPEGVEKYLKKSLEKLQLDYLDLYLVHTPFGYFEKGDDIHPMDENGTMLIDQSTDHVAVWKAMESQVDAGRAKAIGLSNFNSKQIQKILDVARIPPANLQIELHLYFQQKEMVKFSKENNITITAYSPLGTRGTAKIFEQLGIKKELPDLINHPTVQEIAKKYNRSAAQVLLRHTLQRGIAVIPKSVNPNRIKENFQLFDFELSSDDVAKLDALDQGSSARVVDFKFFKGVPEHPEYPF